MARELRDEQRLAVEAVKAAFARGLHRVGFGLFTGGGKTDVNSVLARDLYNLGKRSVTLVHRDILVEQTAERLRLYLPPHAVGIVRGRDNAVDAPVIVASIQTLSRPGRLCQLRIPDVTLVDEAHVSVTDMYRAYYQYVGALPGGPGYLVGCTATWMRSDKIGLGDIWEEVVFQRSIKWGVDNGRIVRPRALQIGDTLDLSGVSTVKNPESADYGDYSPRGLEELVMVEDLLDIVIGGYHEHASGKLAVGFFPTQACARFFAEGFRTGLDGKYPPVVVGEALASTKKSSRLWHMTQFNNGATKILVTCTALGVGWDCPQCGVILGVRPTKSLSAFTQCLGRILRLWPGKREALFLDAVGVTDDHTLRSVVDLSESPGKTERARPAELDMDEPGELPMPMRDTVQHTARKIHATAEVDLFAGTNARWLLTDRGVPFVRTRQHTYYIARCGDSWGVGRCGSTSIQGGRWLVTGLSSEDALEYGGNTALAEDPGVADKRSSWRKTGPAPAQVQYARTLGIDPEGLDKSGLSDAISIRVASSLLFSVQGEPMSYQEGQAG